MRPTTMRGARARANLAWRALALIAMGGCIFEPSRAGGGAWVPADAGAPVCRAGAEEPCACASGGSGRRRCQPDGAWAACVCAGACTPQCAGRVCGDDGCGGPCGACTGDTRCEAGRCVARTVSACAPVDLGSRLGTSVATGTTAAGTTAHTAPCVMTSQDASEVTFAWTAPSAGRYVFSTESSGFDTVLTVRDGACDGAPLACEDDSAGLAQQSRVSVDLAAGQRVSVIIDGFDAQAVGLYALSISRAPSCAPACRGRTCGDDGCGGSCGSCASGFVCASGTCTRSQAEDPCGGVTAGGRCLSANTLERCVVNSGFGTPQRVTLTCGPGEQCMAAAGEARCVLTAVCREGATRCASGAFQRCAGGQWSVVTCNGTCQQTALGAECVARTTGTRTYSGRLQYHLRAPNPLRTGWQSTTTLAVAQGFLVVSLRGSQVLGTTVTGTGTTDGGRFSVPVSATPGPDDLLVFLAAQQDARGEAQLALAFRGLDAQNSPGLPGGCTALGSTTRRCRTDAENPAQRPAVWNWSMRGAELPPDGEIEIRPDYSEPARLFDWARYVYNRARTSLYGRDGDSLVMWFIPGVKWDCGNCQNNVRYSFATASGAPLLFESQIWFSGGPEQLGWADAVTTHELGHWMMDSYGRNPGEGGQHFIGEPVFPGMAWSEGWATFHNAEARQDPVYLSVSSSNDASLAVSMWSLNLDARSYSDPRNRWTRPQASQGLYQRMDENEVASLLWRLSRGTRGAGPIYQAMSAPRARLPTSTGAWERGYNRISWRTNARGIDESTVFRTSDPAPMFADFLDALRCNGFPATDLDGVLVPSTYYPYPSANPLCRR